MFKKIFGNLVMISLSLFIIGCANATSVIKTPVVGHKKFTAFSFEEDNLGISVPKEKIDYFQKKLTEMFEKDNYKQGQGLKIKYSFRAYNEGNRFVRYMIGFGAGKGKMVINTKFYDATTGIKLSETDTEADVSMGLFGGSFDEALDKAVEEIYKFAKNNYMQ